jgi:saccharopine dehydrogenase (NAD+, L-lysine-forming)
MDTKTIMILGGYGNTGRPLARLLLQETQVRLILAGRNPEKSKSLADEFNHDFLGGRVTGAYVDAASTSSLKQAFNGIDFVVVASSTAQYTHQVATAALDAGIGYLDVQYSSQKVALLKSLAEKIEQAGCCFITEGGFHPGLPAVLVRYVARSFDRLEKANVGSVIKVDWKSLEVADSTITELIEEFNDFQMLTFKDGHWKKANMLSMADFVRMDFSEEFKQQYCAPMMLEEMRFLPELYPSLKELGFYVGSFNWFTDWLIMPIAMVALKLWPQKAQKPMGRWMHWGLRTFSKPPYGTLLKVEACGEKDGGPMSMDVVLSHPDGYLFTAVPVAACLLQYLDGTVNKPGLWMQAHIVDPARFMMDIQRMGITMHVQEGS